MNLSYYDDVEPVVDKTKTWLIPKSKTLSSHQIKYRRYYCILSRFESKENEYHWFIAMTDVRDANHNFTPVYKNDNGRVRINLASIWNNTSLNKVDKEQNIDIKLVDEQTDGEVYEILDI